MELATPDGIIAELVSIRDESQRGLVALYDAEMALANATLARETAEAKVLLEATGNVAERQAEVKLKTEKERFNEFLAKAKFNAVKTKMKLLEQAQMNVQTQARLVELMYKSAGVGER